MSTQTFSQLSPNEFVLSKIPSDIQSDFYFVVFYKKIKGQLAVVLEPGWLYDHYCFVSCYPVLENEIPAALYAAAENVAYELDISYVEAEKLMLESYINDYIVEVDASLAASVRQAFENDPRRNVKNGPFVLTGQSFCSSQGTLVHAGGKDYAFTRFGVAEVSNGIYKDLVIDATFDFPSCFDVNSYPIEYTYNLGEIPDFEPTTFDFYDVSKDAMLPLNLSRFISMFQYLYPDYKQLVKSLILANLASVAAYSDWGEDYTDVEKLSEMLERDRESFLPS